MPKRRSINSTPKSTALDELLSGTGNSANNKEEQATPSSSSAPHENAFKFKHESVPLNLIRLNYKNKRVITQFIRFIPDKLAAEALDQNEVSPAQYVLEHIAEITVNNIVSSFIKIDGKVKDGVQLQEREIEQDKYPRHYDLYDYKKEGVFIGKGICFHNVPTQDKVLQNQLDDFVDAVVTNGKSLAYGELVEDPRLHKVGAMYTIVFGHNRYCYLVFQFGLEYVHYFRVEQNKQQEDQKIYKENNTSREETGYEKLLSMHYSVREALQESGLSEEEIAEALASDKREVEYKGKSPTIVELCTSVINKSKSYLYSVRPFLIDKRLIEVVKQNNIGMSLREILEAYTSVKKALKALGENVQNNDVVFEGFKQKLELDNTSGTDKNTEVEHNKEKPKAAMVSLKVPASESALEKLLFTDIRKWSKVKTDDYDLTKKKGIKAYFEAVLDEISES